MSKSPDISTDEGRRQFAKSVDYMLAEYNKMGTDPKDLVWQCQSAIMMFTPLEIVQMFVTILHHANGHKIYEPKPQEPQPHSITESGQRALTNPISELGWDMMLVGYGEARLKEPDQYTRMMAGRKAFEQSPFSKEELEDMLVIVMERLTDNVNT